VCKYWGVVLTLLNDDDIDLRLQIARLAANHLHPLTRIGGRVDLCGPQNHSRLFDDVLDYLLKHCAPSPALLDLLTRTICNPPQVSKLAEGTYVV